MGRPRCNRVPLIASMMLALLAAAALARPAAALEFGDPNMSPDAAYCRSLTEKFHRAAAVAGTGAQVDDARKAGERGAKLCRFERYREGITLLERALAALPATAN